MLLRLYHARLHRVVDRSPIILPLVRPVSISIPSVSVTSSPSGKAQANVDKEDLARPDRLPNQEFKSSSIDPSLSNTSRNKSTKKEASKKSNLVRHEERGGSQKGTNTVSSISTPTTTTTSTTDDTLTSTLPSTFPSSTVKDSTNALALKTTSDKIEAFEPIVNGPSASSNEKNTALRESPKTLQERHRLSDQVSSAEKLKSSSSVVNKNPVKNQRSANHYSTRNTSTSKFKTTSRDWAFLQGAFLQKPAGPSPQNPGHRPTLQTPTSIKALPNQRKTERWQKRKLDTKAKGKNKGTKIAWNKAKRWPASATNSNRFLAKPKKDNQRKVLQWDASWEEMWDGKKAVQDVTLLPPQSNQEPVPGLEHEFDRALFKPGVHFYQDPKTNVYNFNKRAQAIAHPDEFDLDRLCKYVTASKDRSLAKLASDNQCSFFGSTSSITASLSQIFFALSNNRPVDTSSLSYHFFGLPITTSYSASVPCSIFLRYNEKTETYGIDGDKTMEHVGQPTHLMDLGHVMEKMLTTTVEDVKRYRKDAPEDAISEEERNKRETYHYSKGPDIIMRSQLDGYDSRLPGTGIFDIKTRATASIRHDIENIEGGKHYEITSDVGLFESFERERYDMMRSAFLKYNFQGRIGGMSGMFVAYHNTANIQGLEYFPLTQLDKYLFGSTEMGDQAYSMCVKAFSRLLKQATKQFPKQTLHLTLSAKDSHEPNSMIAIVKPVDTSGVVSDTKIVGLKLSFYSTVQDKPVNSSIDLGPEGTLPWKVLTRIEKSSPVSEENLAFTAKMMRKDQEELGSSVVLPPHMTKQEMQDVFAARWEKVKAAQEDRPATEAAIAVVKAEKDEPVNHLNKEIQPEIEPTSSSELFISTSTPTSTPTPTPTLMIKDRPPHLEERPPRLRFRPASQLVTILRALSERARLRALSPSSSSALASDSEPLKKKPMNRHLDKRLSLPLSAEKQAAQRLKAIRKRLRRQRKKAERFQSAVEAKAETGAATGMIIEGKDEAKTIEAVAA